MKILTLDLYERIIDAVYEKSKYYFNMLGSVDHSQCAEYIGFYAHHNGLFWSEQNGKICGISTAHPGKRDFDWTWGTSNGIWTAHLVWADNTKSHAEVLKQFLESQSDPVYELWTWRNQHAVALTKKKLERILSYGRRRNNYSAGTSASIQRVDAINPARAGGNGASGLCIGGAVPAVVQSASDPAASGNSTGFAESSKGNVSSGCGN